MRVKTFSPIRALHGKVGNSDIVYMNRTDRIFARAASRPFNPNSPDQQKVRAYLATAAKAWSTLTDAQRQAWLDYAAAYFTTNADGETIDPSGLTAYVRANTVRLILALPLTTTAPTLAPPPPITGIAQTPEDDDDTIGLILTHAITPVTGLKVIIRATPPTLTPARAPRATDLRYIRGVSPNSAYDLPTSGTPLIITPTRYTYPPDSRFGVEVRVLRPTDCIPSNSATAEFHKAVP